jgi:hypothetical protein
MMGVDFGNLAVRMVWILGSMGDAVELLVRSPKLAGIFRFFLPSTGYWPACLLLHLSAPAVKQLHAHPQLLGQVADLVGFVAHPNGLGVYFLRTNLPIKEEGVIWNIYSTIREIEGTFRTLKTDLDLRPIYHRNDASTMAHLHLGVLAYWR